MPRDPIIVVAVRSDIDIWMHDLSTGQEHQITSAPGPECNAQIVGDIIFYEGRDPQEGFATVFRQELSALGL